MIKLENINKYYNRNKINQNQVCKDINLEFGNKGLVVILGSSGSGKTTLLNIISGMDKFSSGTISFDGVEFSKYNAKKWDVIRKDEIGYIYQNYHLLKDLTVYENIEPVLKMQGITDNEEIRSRVTYLLNAVGLSNYEDRLVKQLSGGQQQRVAFARALSSDPRVILADEPTGNLDSKTTVELMSTIKEVSKNKLVIMVTHEQALADYFADRIIEIDNGRVVKDYENKKSENLDLIQEQIIYLKDYEQSNIKDDKLNINRYVNENVEEADKIELNLIERNETLYVKVDAKNKRRIKYIDSDSEIELRNESSKDFKEKQSDFIIQKINRVGKEKQSVITIKDSFKYALRKINKLNYGGKMLYLVLMLVGVLVSLSVGFIGEVFRVEEPFTVLHQNYITVVTDKVGFDNIQGLNDIDGVKQLMYINEPITFNIETSKYYEVKTSVDFEAMPVDMEFFDETTLIYGELPVGYDIVIDKSVADMIISQNSDRGILDYEDVINADFKIQAYGLDTDFAYDTGLYYNISGIANANSLSVWMPEDLIYSFATPNLIDYHILGDGFTITNGDVPTSSRYILLNSAHPSIKEGVIPYNVGITTGSYYIAGVYEYYEDGDLMNYSNIFGTEKDYLKYEYFKYSNLHKTHYEVLVYSDDPETTLEALKTAGYTAEANYYDEGLAKQIKFEENQNVYLLGIGGIVMAAISILFIMRSSLISRIYEVSVYRSIGSSRGEVRKMFIVEIILTTTISSVIGFLLMMILLNQAESGVEYINLTHFTFLSVILGLIGLYAINIGFGLIPVNLLLKQTPSDIMRKYDL